MLTGFLGDCFGVVCLGRDFPKLKRIEHLDVNTERLFGHDFSALTDVGRINVVAGTFSARMPVLNNLTELTVDIVSPTPELYFTPSFDVLQRLETLSISNTWIGRQSFPCTLAPGLGRIRVLAYRPSRAQPFSGPPLFWAVHSWPSPGPLIPGLRPFLH